MARILFKVFFGIITTLTNVILTPVNLLVSGLFPDLSNIIARFTYACNTYLGGGLTWFYTIIPTNARNLITIYVTILISYYTISISVHAILKVYTIIKNVKIW